jgi:hypothetical protein
MLMRFTVSLPQRYKNAMNFKTYTLPAFYAKHVLNEGALSVMVFKRNVQFACQCRIVRLPKPTFFSLRNAVTSKHEKVKAFFQLFFLCKTVLLCNELLSLVLIV